MVAEEDAFVESAVAASPGAVGTEADDGGGAAAAAVAAVCVVAYSAVPRPAASDAPAATTAADDAACAAVLPQPCVDSPTRLSCSVVLDLDLSLRPILRPYYHISLLH